MQPYSIQSVLDWLEFKGLLKNRHYAEASILCDLNSGSLAKSLSRRFSLVNCILIGLVSISLLYFSNRFIPVEYHVLALGILTISTFSTAFIPQKPRTLEPWLIGCFIAIGAAAAYLTLVGQLHSLFTQFDGINISLHLSLLFIVVVHLFALKRDKNFIMRKGFFLLSFTVCGLIGLIHPTLIIASLIAISGYKQANLWLIGLGVCLSALATGWFIDNLDFSWHQKSMLMMGTGLGLRLVQSMIHHFDWQDEG